MSRSEAFDTNIARAAAHPLRMRILAALDDRAMALPELTEALGADARNVQRHADWLVKAGLVSKSVSPRGTIFYDLASATSPHYSDARWSELSTPAKRAVTAAAIQALHPLATSAALDGGFDRENAHYSRHPLTLDEQGFAELSEAYMKIIERLAAVERESAERVEAGATPLEVAAVLMLFERHAARAKDDDPHAGAPGSATTEDRPSEEVAWDLHERLDEALTSEDCDWSEVVRLADELRVVARGALVDRDVQSPATTLTP